MDDRQALIASIELCTDLHELLKLDDLIWEPLLGDTEGKWIRPKPGFEGVGKIIRDRRLALLSRDTPFTTTYLGVFHEGDEVRVDCTVATPHPLEYVSVPVVVGEKDDG